MARLGRKNRPFYRVGAFDARTRRDGAPIEYLGWYDPLVADFDKAVELDLDRVKHWIEMGAKCSDTVASFIKRKGVVLPRHVRLSGPKSRGKSKS
jgi:small subunit ribosomal protein S16